MILGWRSQRLSWYSYHIFNSEHFLLVGQSGLTLKQLLVQRSANRNRFLEKSLKIIHDWAQKSYPRLSPKCDPRSNPNFNLDRHFETNFVLPLFFCSLKKSLNVSCNKSKALLAEEEGLWSIKLEAGICNNTRPDWWPLQRGQRQISWWCSKPLHEKKNVEQNNCVGICAASKTSELLFVT